MQWLINRLDSDITGAAIFKIAILMASVPVALSEGMELITILTFLGVICSE